jgi:two-component system, NtrC family, sensor kinase
MAAEGVMNEPRPSEAPAVPSTERITTSLPVPASWIDRLLSVQCGLRPDGPIEEGVTQILGVVRELLDDVAVGACIPQKVHRGSTVGAAGPGAPALRPHTPESGPPSRPSQLVVRLAGGLPRRPADPDPTRLFPELSYERVVVIADDGATLHAASDDEGRIADGSPGGILIERVVMMIGAILEQRRAIDRRLEGLRAQVIQSEKLASLGQIAAGIVHELNNPLTTIVAYSDFLRKKTERKGGEAADVERLARINEAAERILRFSRDLTAYSRPADEVPAPVAIHDVIERALVFCEHELGKTGVIIERQFGEVRAVRGVAGQLTQVFVNLFTNAAHAMRTDGGLLTIATSMTDDEVTVVISDEGHGIDEEHRARVFEPFFTTKTDGSGTGLGLSIVRSIIQSHGGNIRVDGRDPRGSVFHVALPCAAAPKSDH